MTILNYECLCAPLQTTTWKMEINNITDGKKRDYFCMQIEWLKLVQIRNQDCSTKGFLKVIEFIFISDFFLSLRGALRLEKYKNEILHIASSHSNVILFFRNTMQQFQKETKFIDRLSELRFRNNKQHRWLTDWLHKEAIKSRE